MKYFVYFLQSKRDTRYYIGCTTKDPNDRLKEHNAGQVSSTKHRRPFELAHYETFDNRHDAFKREWYLKHPVGYQEKLMILASIESRRLGL